MFQVMVYSRFRGRGRGRRGVPGRSSAGASSIQKANGQRAVGVRKIAVNQHQVWTRMEQYTDTGKVITTYFTLCFLYKKH